MLAKQKSLVSRAQLNAAGIDDMAISRRLRWGLWQRVLPATYLVTNGQLTDEQRRIAASLYGGEMCQVTGAAALRCYGFRYAPSSDSVHLLVPHEQRLRSTGFVVAQRTLKLDHNARVTDHYQICSPARAVVGLLPADD